MGIGNCNRFPRSHGHTATTDDGGVLSVIEKNTQTGTTYTLVIGDAGKVVEMNNASANTLTVPPNSSVAFPIGTLIQVDQYGAGITTIAQGAGVTINSEGSKKRLSAQHISVSLRKRATDEWQLTGSLIT